MKVSRSSIVGTSRALPELRFEDQQLTSFAGLVLFQELFAKLFLRDRLQRCFKHLPVAPIFGHARIVMLLVVHVLLGYRRLGELRYYQDDPQVARTLQLARLPDASTVSRGLAMLDADSVVKLRGVCRDMVLQRLSQLRLARVTLDFDGSVIGTCRFAEGSAIGYNKKKKGQRSYYPLFCTVAQTGQVLDVWHRPGNVHDSNGAREFIVACLQAIRRTLPQAILEVRMDSAFFSDEILTALNELNVRFTVSVPFERFTELKAQISARTRWRAVSRTHSYFESDWKPKCWERRLRFVFIRECTARQRKEPAQLDLFTPYEYGYEFKVIVTNTTLSAGKVLSLHNGRGAQEGLFAELKSHAHLDYIPARRLCANQTWLLAVLLAHNLNRELQMQGSQPERVTTEQRAPLWSFTRLATLRRHLLHRAGRFTRPQGKLTLTLSPNDAVEDDLLRYLKRAA
jgi:hypothetical protein